MAEDLIVNTLLGKKERYEMLMPQVRALVEGEKDPIANVANITAALATTFSFLWTGVYFVRGNEAGEELVLGPFQGPVACTRIKKGKGVCGTAWEKKETIIVPDVDKFPGHIACSSLSKSEIVIPVFSEDRVIAVLDVDSDRLSTFDETDKIYLEEIGRILSAVI